MRSCMLIKFNCIRKKRNQSGKMSVSKAVNVLPLLRKLSKTKQKSSRQKLLQSCPCDVIKVIKAIAKNTLKGHIHLTPKQKQKLKKYKREVRRIAGKLSTNRAKRVLIQKGGLLPGLLVPAISILANLVANRLAK